MCLSGEDTHADEIFRKYNNDMTLLMNNVPIMPRDGINEPQMVIFPQIFSVYSLKLSLACLFELGDLSSSDSPTPFFLIPELLKGIISNRTLECHLIATQ